MFGKINKIFYKFKFLIVTKMLRLCLKLLMQIKLLRMKEYLKKV